MSSRALDAPLPGTRVLLFRCGRPRTYRQQQRNSSLEGTISKQRGGCSFDQIMSIPHSPPPTPLRNESAFSLCACALLSFKFVVIIPITISIRRCPPNSAHPCITELPKSAPARIRCDGSASCRRTCSACRQCSRRCRRPAATGRPWCGRTKWINTLRAH